MNARTMLAIAGMLTFTFTGAARAEEMATPLAPPAKTTSETPALVESLKLEAAVFSQTYYRRGDEIVLQLDVDPRTAAVNADFSAVDSQFRPAAPRVEVTGRTERVIRYKLSQGNTRKAGTYQVAVHLEPAAGGATVTRKFPIEYLPGGPGELIVPTGNFVAGQLPRRERHREMSVVAALRQDGQASVKNRIDPTKPVELSLVLSSPRRLSPNSLKLELAEARGDAFWRVPIRLTAERCTPGGCQYQALTSLDLGPDGGGNGNRTPALAGQLVTSGGAAVPFDLPGLGKTSRPSSPTHRVSGTLRFQYQDRQPDPSPSTPCTPGGLRFRRPRSRGPSAMPACAWRTSAGTTSPAPPRPPEPSCSSGRPSTAASAPSRCRPSRPARRPPRPTGSTSPSIAPAISRATATTTGPTRGRSSSTRPRPPSLPEAGTWAPCSSAKTRRPPGLSTSSTTS